MQKRQTKTLKDALRADALNVLREWYPNGKVRGGEFMVGSVAGEDGESLKVDLEKGVWCDFAAPDQKGGDLLSLYEAYQRCDWKRAYDDLAPRYGLAVAEGAPLPRPPPPPPAPRETKAEPIIAFPAPEDYPKRGSIQYEYRAAGGELMFIVARVERPDGGKDFFPFRPIVNVDGVIEWEMRAYPEPRPLYGLPQIAIKDVNTRVIVVEGEKAAQSLLERKPKNPVLTWCGGSRAWHKTDWTPIFGREVILWPDNDDAGRTAMTGIAELLVEHGCTVRVLGVADELSANDGGDCADLPPEERFAVLARLMATATVMAPALPDPQLEERPPLPDEPPPGVEPAAEEEKPDAVEYLLPVPLGMEGDCAVILDRGGPKIWNCSIASLRQQLPSFARLEDWQQSRWYREGKINWDIAHNWYWRRCVDLGNITEDKVREFGVWRDRGRVVANLIRNTLWVDGEIMDARKVDTAHIYVSRDGWIDEEPPLDTDTAATVLSALAKINWAHPYHGVALAGWLACAPIGGTMEWRPNLWLTGPSGGGKSWTLDNIVKHLLDPVAFAISGSATEAGIRQSCRDKAIPIIWDEFEAETQRDTEKRRAVMDIVRAATSGKPRIVKGGAQGESQSFGVPFTFLFASISARLSAEADFNRTLNIEILPAPRYSAARLKRNAAFGDLRKIVGNWPKDIGLRWVWRSVRMADVIAQSIATIIPLIAEKQNRRTADLHAPLLAGYWSVGHDEPVTEQEARDLVEGIYADFVTASGASREDRLDLTDEHQALDHMLDAIRGSTIDGRREERSMREYVAAAIINGGDWNLVLRRFGLGLSADRKFLQIASSHRALADILKDSPWSTGWIQVLRRLEGCRKMQARDFREDNDLVKRQGIEIPVTYCDLERFGVRRDD